MIQSDLILISIERIIDFFTNDRMSIFTLFVPESKAIYTIMDKESSEKTESILKKEEWIDTTLIFENINNSLRSGTVIGNIAVPLTKFSVYVGNFKGVRPDDVCEAFAKEVCCYCII